MRILVVNDDGIYSEGIKRMAEFAMNYGEVWVVAPDAQCSAMSHKGTISGHLTIIRHDDFPIPVKRAYSVSGSPADCVKMALYCIMGQKRPDYVFSGINDGYNSGFDAAYSGTVGAAMEGLMFGIPTIAYSNAYQGLYEVYDHYKHELTDMIFAKEPLTDAIWNLNFPGCPLSDCKGVLYDRKVAHYNYYKNRYEKLPRPKNGEPVLVELGSSVCRGKKTVVDISYFENHSVRPDDGTDVSALSRLYVSVGTVKCNVLI